MVPTPSSLARSAAEGITRLALTPIDPVATTGRVIRRGRPVERTLAGRIVMVTGASSGIGRATAVRLGAAGAHVIVVARSEDLLAEVVTQIVGAGGTATAHRADLTCEHEIDALVAKTLDQHGHVDVVVNNAGLSIRRKVRHSVDRFHDFERPMQLNYFAPVRLVMGFLPTMVERETGQIVNVSSWAAQLHPPRFSGYVASKSALEAWSDSVQAEVAGDGVVFTNIRMPLVRTPMIEPARLYRSIPALDAATAGDVVVKSILNRSRRVTPPLAMLVGWVDQASTGIGDLIRRTAV